MANVPIQESDIRRQVENLSGSSYWEKMLETAKSMLLHIQDMDLSGVVVFNYDDPVQLTEDKKGERVPAVCISTEIAQQYHSGMTRILQDVTNKDILGMVRFLDVPMKDGTRGIFCIPFLVKNQL